MIIERQSEREGEMRECEDERGGDEREMEMRERGR
jgi:hypothetical protein